MFTVTVYSPYFKISFWFNLLIFKSILDYLLVFISFIILINFYQGPNW